MQAGITISGINAEVMPGQWEFQIGEMLELSPRPLRTSLAGRCGGMPAYNPSGPLKGCSNLHHVLQQGL